MFILLPRHVKRGVGAVTFLFLALMLASMCVSAIATLLFTGPRLLTRGDLLSIPCVAFIGFVLYRLLRRLSRNAIPDPDSDSLFRQHGFTAWVIFLLMLSAVGLGSWMGVGNSRADRDQRLADAWQHQRAATPASERGTNFVVMGASKLQLKMIFANTKTPTAVINDQTVNVGAKFGDWHVTKIGSRSVVVQNTRGDTDVLLAQ